MNLKHDRYFQTHQNEPFFFYLSSKSLEDDIRWILDNNIENIKLSEYEPYCIHSIDVLLAISPSVKRLSLHIKNADLSRIKDFAELVALSIGETPSKVDLTGLSKVKELYLMYSRNIRGLETMTGLNALTLVNAQTAFFCKEIHPVFSRLSILQILSGRIPETLNFLRSATKLRELELFNLKVPISLYVLTTCTLIEILKLEKCRKIESLETTVRSLKSLKYLSLIDAGTIKNAAFIDDLPALKTLVIVGSSFFVEGDIDILKKLNWVSIDDKKHYSLKNKHLNKIVELPLTTAYMQ
jgi:hypothetical protein